MQDSFSSNGKSNMDLFFELMDSIEEDIAEISAAETEVIGVYECLFIGFSNLREYCRDVQIKWEQIEDQYLATVGESENEEQLDPEFEDMISDEDEVGGFYKLLELVERALKAYEARCQKMEDPFDEWGMVLVLYSFLRKYCHAAEIPYGPLQAEIENLHREMDLGDEADPGVH